MTAEIVILNRSGIALAADSALTVGRERVWKNSNKLFSLSPRNDIGIMIYGAGDFLGYPWEVVIKEFRQSVSSRATYRTVDDCRREFVEFLKGDTFRDDFQEELSFSYIFVKLISGIKGQLNYQSKMEFRQQVRDVTSGLLRHIEDRDVALPELKLQEFTAEFGEKIERFAKSELNETITKPIKAALVKFCWEFARRAECYSDFETGVVFGGYGREEFYPVGIHTIVDGRSGEHLRYWEFSSENLNEERTMRGLIVPFGQDDIAHLFMEGIAVEQLEYLQDTLSRVLAAKSDELVRQYVHDEDERIVEGELQQKDNEKIVTEFMREFGEYRSKSLVKRVMKVISSLPKEEMAAMAEALVELTSLRRKVDSDVQSVGGPADVAVISKGDGFIWVKRKHYFDIAYNRDFMQRKSMRLTEGGSDEPEA